MPGQRTFLSGASRLPVFRHAAGPSALRSPFVPTDPCRTLTPRRKRRKKSRRLFEMGAPGADVGHAFAEASPYGEVAGVGAPRALVEVLAQSPSGRDRGLTDLAGLR